MVKTIEAVFDGEVFRFEDPLILEPSTRVRITIETMDQSTGKPMSFLDTACSLNLDGSPDWATNMGSLAR